MWVHMTMRISDAVQEHVDSGSVVGLAWGLMRGDSVETGAAGVTEEGGTTATTPDTIFRIASMSKPVTATAAMILVEEGKLALDDPVDDLLPELANRQVLRNPDGPLDDTVPAERPITLRDLLTFTFGIGMDFARYGQQPVLNRLAELGAGMGPPNPQEPATYDTADGLWTTPPAFPSGGGGLLSTVNDFLAFGDMLRRGGKPILTEESVTAMTTNHLTDAQLAAGGPDPSGALGFGLCMGVQIKPGDDPRHVGSYGWDGGLGTSWANDPEADAVGVILTNEMFGGPDAPPRAIRAFWNTAIA